MDHYRKYQTLRNDNTWHTSLTSKEPTTSLAYWRRKVSTPSKNHSIKQHHTSNQWKIENSWHKFSMYKPSYPCSGQMGHYILSIILEYNTATRLGNWWSASTEHITQKRTPSQHTILLSLHDQGRHQNNITPAELQLWRWTQIKESLASLLFLQAFNVTTPTMNSWRTSLT